MMKEKFKNNCGFSLIEIMIVIAILALLSAGVTIWFFNYRLQAEMDSGVKTIINVLRDAQTRSISGKDSRLWGVYFDSAGNKVFLFRDDGTGFAGSTVKEENNLSSALKINSGSVSGGCGEIIFNKPGGGTALDCTIKIEEAGNSGSFTNIIITKAGRIDR